MVNDFESGITLLSCSQENTSSGHALLTAAVHSVCQRQQLTSNQFPTTLMKRFTILRMSTQTHISWTFMSSGT